LSETFFEPFSGNLDLAARLIQDNGKSKEDAYSKIAVYYIGKKQFDQAVEYFEKAGDPEGLKKAYKEIAWSCYNKDDYENAAIYFEKIGNKEMAEKCRKQ
jgi:tetratricopeptide (TPR) repeat protein